MLSCIIPSDSKSLTLAFESYRSIQDAFEGLPFMTSYKRLLSQTSPSPFLVDTHTYREFAIAHDAIVAGLRAVVSQWSTNKKLQEKLPVHPRISKLLQRAPPSYSMGTMRPDLLLGEDGSIKVCEINGRFPLNGYLLAAVANNVLHELSMQPSSLLSKTGHSAVSAGLTFLPDLKKRLTANSSDVWILNDKEPEHDLAALGAVLEITPRHCRPEQLRAVDNALYCQDHDGSLTEICSCVLELHQDEFLALSDEVLEALANLSFQGKTLNDLRGIFLVHDKRMLHVLLSDCYELDSENRELLRKYIVPTALPDQLEFIERDAEHSSLVLKPCLCGKGEGIIMQKNMSAQEFNAEMTARTAEAPHVVQVYVEQRHFDVMDHNGEMKRCKTVGTLSSLDGTFYGPGGFRSNNCDLISLVGGGIVSFPVLKLHGIPGDARSLYNDLQPADTTVILESLKKHGIALVGVRKRLGDKQELASFLKNLGAKCQSHSDVDGEVWDVRPAQKWTTKSARSHTSRPFEIHTDASFEKDPPEYVAMSVIHADRCGGGRLSLAKISDAVNQLHENDREVLMKVKPRWVVPEEFRKSGAGDVFAPVLMSSERARFRMDKILTDHLPAKEREAFQQAFKRFCAIVEESNSEGMIVPEQSIIILDNQRFAHARSTVLDMNRHLHRVRFDLPKTEIKA